jgi:AmmeMemoRadiSam system protein A
MARTSSLDASRAFELDPDEAQQLLEVAALSIHAALGTGTPLELDAADYPEGLRDPRATFVTLHRHGELRGCIGELEARRPVVESVANMAFKSAFRDPRFPPLREAELRDLTLEISILGPLQPMKVDDEADLLRQLRPGVDGLVLRSGSAQGTYLPSVWESLPEPCDFVAQLLHKAGIPSWPSEIEVDRFFVQSISGAIRWPTMGS